MFTKESKSLRTIFHGKVILPMEYLSKVLCSYESVGLNVQANIKIGNLDLYFMVK